MSCFISCSFIRCLMCRLLRKAMEHALKLISYYDPNRINVELITVDLRNSLLDFHKLLNEYREHEGR